MIRSFFKICGLFLLAGLLSAGAGTSFAQTCGTTTWDLTAGQTIVVGTVTVSNDTTNLYVTYKLDDTTQPDAYFGVLHLWVGNDLATLPKTPTGNLKIGQFPYKGNDPPAANTRQWTFTIPFTDFGIPDVAKVCPLTLYVVPHAEVKSVRSGTGVGDQTAFGGDTVGDTGARWWFYGAYSICCDFGPPPIRSCQTAFGKGGYVFTTDRKSNPENAPTLGLSKNRWGWAINRTTYGTTTHDIWAGAGLNKTSNGTRVGTLSVSWDGTQVTVTYTLFAPFDMEELHIYAGDLKPTTVAPGQYGYIEYFDPPATTHTATFDVSDSNYDGIWVIAHAVVCAAQQN